ncbi:MAG: minor capsid protein [Lactobacillus crispatus]|nr:minor capsid protein [Lactobacillus iners]MCT7770575.1 minor capsid protein [Lactobacillus crispatus]
MKKKTNRYWEDRAEDERKWQLEQFRVDEKFNKTLDRSYQIAVDNINKQIEHELARIGGIQKLVTPEQMSEYERMAQQVVARANNLRAAGHKVSYEDFPQAVNDRLKAYNATMRISQLELMKSEVGLPLIDLGMDLECSIGDKVYSDYLKEKKRQAGIISKTLVNNEKWASRKTVDSATANVTVGDFSKNVWANVDTLKANLDGLLSTAIIRGDNPRELIKYLKPLVKETVLNKRYAAERIARTESARVQYKAQLDSLKTNDYKYCKWYIEPGACKACREIAISNSGGNLPEGIYEVDDCPDIPVHPNCRCSIGAWWKDETSYSKYDKEIIIGQKSQLTDDEIWAMNNYVGFSSYRLNSMLRNNKKLEPLQNKMVKNIDSALDKLPIYKSKKPLFRSFSNALGNTDELNNLISCILENGFYTDKGFISTAKKVYDDDDYFRIVIAKSHSGRDVSSIRSDESEVLFKRNTVFKVLRCYNKENKMFIEVEEIGSR